MIIKLLDIYGHEYEIPDLKSFIGHIKKYHTIDGNPDNSIHEENGYYFRVDHNFMEILKNMS
ncbi:MAG: hypothetical protein ACJ0OM_02660 [Candidatus Marisimplicoccus sp.]|tara:strand:- start:1243 stop:1428 length:186 start_codon:yes stop_codon:yes gene_type:complete